MSPDELALTPEHARLLLRFEELLELLPRAEEEREHLVGHTLPLLNARYLQLVGSAHLGLLQLRLEAFELKRKSEMIRSYVNRGEEVLIEVIDTLLSAEMKAEREKIEAEARRIQAAQSFFGSPVLTDKQSAELKKLYYELARILHPDLNPEQTAERAELWLQVAEAYRNGDLERLRVLQLLAQENASPADASVATGLEELKSKVERLQAALDRVVENVAVIKEAFPYSHIEKLDDPDWLAEQHAYIRKSTEAVEEEIRMYRQLIDALLEGGAA
ncbi:MAG: hypothetical protein RL021_1657 [Bacteroidota bacterium]|jgi:hypothetical protein